VGAMRYLRNIPEREVIAIARPDSISDFSQLKPGRAVIEFAAFYDYKGAVNCHTAKLAVVRGPAYRILGEVSVNDSGIKCVPVEKLPAFTKDEHAPSEDNSLFDITGTTIEDREVVRNSFNAGYFNAGLLAVRDEPYRVEQNLEVGPGLYVNGSNDYYMVFNTPYMAVALDSDPRLVDWPY